LMYPTHLIALLNRQHLTTQINVPTLEATTAVELTYNLPAKNA
jgi:hypothetical protein